MKKPTSAVDNMVMDVLWGLAAAHPHELSIDLDQHITYCRRPKEQGEVAIISRGGSGYELLHGGSVGTGMLDAAYTGEISIFLAPSQVVAATSTANRGASVLHIVKDYTDDVMNSGIVAETVEAESGIQVASAITNNDVAVEDFLHTVGRRGVGVTVTVGKITGITAEQGRPPDEVTGITVRVNAVGRSMGMTLTFCTVSANGKPSSDLPEGEMETGIGIHSEPGRHREKIAPAVEIAERLVTPTPARLAAFTEPENTGVDEGVIAMINDTGVTSLLKLYLMYEGIVHLPEGAGITVVRNLMGNYTISLDMTGYSLILVRVDTELLSLWDAPVNMPDLHWGA